MLRQLMSLKVFGFLWGLVFLFNPLAQGAIMTGGKNGITIDFIYDYQCPYCHAMYPEIKKLSSEGYTIRWMPVAIIHNPLSLEEATGAIASTQCQGGFNRYQSETMAGTVLSGDSINQLTETFNTLCPQFIATQHSSWVESALDENTQALQAYQVQGVPVTVLYPTAHPSQKITLQGEVSPQTIKEAINALNHPF